LFARVLQSKYDQMTVCVQRSENKLYESRKYLSKMKEELLDTAI